jgi:GDPmannose 4,6-dehydratase|tara:strand:- start:110 stop:1018 length:909 start_codon:yes stop_codon:yes gene_type:complete
MPSALITGITGQDGSYLKELLTGKRYVVHGWQRDECDVTNLESLRVALQQSQPDEIYHLAAKTHVGQSVQDEAATMEVNVQGTINLLESAREFAPNARIFFASSSEIFGRPEESPQTEKTPLNPVNPYGISKARATVAVQQARAGGICAVNGMLYNHESPRRRSSFVTQKICQGAAAIQRREQTKLKLGDTSAARDWSDARDVVRGMWQSLQADAADDYIFASGQLHTVQEVIEIAFETAGLEWQQCLEIDESLFRDVEPCRLVGDASKARAVLDWEPKNSFRELIVEMTQAAMQDQATRSR